MLSAQFIAIRTIQNIVGGLERTLMEVCFNELQSKGSPFSPNLETEPPAAPTSPRVPTSPTQLGIRSTSLLPSVTTQPGGGACVETPRKHQAGRQAGRQENRGRGSEQDVPVDHPFFSLRAATAPPSADSCQPSRPAPEENHCLRISLEDIRQKSRKITAPWSSDKRETVRETRSLETDLHRTARVIEFSGAAESPSCDRSSVTAVDGGNNSEASRVTDSKFKQPPARSCTAVSLHNLAYPVIL
ncbi:hypothetical protein K0M31_007834 [Melipona bicolor]|uniref:Uncharacterized protein n=1 Tax=Melipona bicolor TaxID=60889 RepID=A0AA40GCG8_9HYME|nr:hypothetical protein K0M31_007834 [Melipona bicolor]